MRTFRDPEELVAAYWQKLASSVESGGGSPHSKTQALNGRLRSRPSRDNGRVRQRSAALRNGRHLSETRGAFRHDAGFHSHSNS